jgi:hypothetical protein
LTWPSPDRKTHNQVDNFWQTANGIQAY